ncbi:hypothetical protein MASR2M79_02700 [Aminivibrio sp.]
MRSSFLPAESLYAPSYLRADASGLAEQSFDAATPEDAGLEARRDRALTRLRCGVDLLLASKRSTPEG